MLQGEHCAILVTFIKLPFVIKIFVLSIFEWPFCTGFTVISINTVTLDSEAARKTVQILIRRLHQELSDQDLYCLQYKPPKYRETCPK